jgi:hypothetical protein
MSFKKAERKQAKIKIAITGPSGAGKTYSALLIAKGMTSKIAIIDTEHGSASLYSDNPNMPSYDVMELGAPFSTDRYIAAIQDAVKAGYELLIIDSITHQWSGQGGILDRLDRERQANPKANSYTMWNKLTPEHERFKQAIVQAPIHIIATMRSKQDYHMEKDDNGKQKVSKMGYAPIQREGAEYEFTTVFDLAQSHFASVSKDRTGIFGAEPFLPSPATGELISKWLNAAPTESQPDWRVLLMAQVKAKREQYNLTPDEVINICAGRYKKSPKTMEKDEFTDLFLYMDELYGAKPTHPDLPPAIGDVPELAPAPWETEANQDPRIVK